MVRINYDSREYKLGLSHWIKKTKVRLGKTLDYKTNVINKVTKKYKIIMWLFMWTMFLLINTLALLTIPY